MIEVGKRVRIVGADYWIGSREFIGTYGRIINSDFDDDNYPNWVELENPTDDCTHLRLTDEELEVVASATS